MVNRSTLATLVAAYLLIGCATIPGKTGSDQKTNADQLIERTLKDLYKQSPQAEKQIAESVGYAIMDNKITKVPVFGAGAGYGVAVDNPTGEKTYLVMRRLDFGAGWGARSVRPVVIFHNKDVYAKFKKGLLKATIGAEASAKVGESGAAGGGGSGTIAAKDLGYKSYMITDAGVSATASLAVIRVKPVRLKK